MPGGFDSAVRFAHVLAQPALFFLKLVEPACERQRVGRVETMVRVSGVLGSGSGYRLQVVSTQPFASLTCWLNQLRRRRVHVLAQPASEKERSWAGSTGFGGEGRSVTGSTLDRGISGCAR